MAKVTIYHHPRCSKSRQALQIIRDHGYDPEIILYQETPPTTDRLDALCRAMGKHPIELVRTKDPLFTELGLSEDDRRGHGEWIRLLVENPALIERPIVVHGKDVILGRPPEIVREII